MASGLVYNACCFCLQSPTCTVCARVPVYTCAHVLFSILYFALASSSVFARSRLARGVAYDKYCNAIARYMFVIYPQLEVTLICAIFDTNVSRCSSYVLHRLAARAATLSEGAHCTKMPGFYNKTIWHHTLRNEFATRFPELVTIFFVCIYTNIIYKLMPKLSRQHRKVTFFSKTRTLDFVFWPRNPRRYCGRVC